MPNLGPNVERCLVDRIKDLEIDRILDKKVRRVGDLNKVGRLADGLDIDNIQIHRMPDTERRKLNAAQTGMGLTAARACQYVPTNESYLVLPDSIKSFAAFAA
jgi:hypothetical protein